MSTVSNIKKVASLKEMLVRLENEPKPVFIYPGIKEKSLGVVFGPSKTGKTMFCETLGMSIAAGANTFMGKPLTAKTDSNVLMISLEEYWNNRTERNAKQAVPLIKQYGDDWVGRFSVATEFMNRYIVTDQDWTDLTGTVIEMQNKPDVIIIDSLSHLVNGSIEDSATATALMAKLRSFTDTTGATVIVIHHTHKMYGSGLSQDNMAGSRMVSQELDFAIGLNKTLSGVKYIKEVFFRYAACESEEVETFKIADECWLQPIGSASEFKLLAPPDGRKDISNTNKILEFITSAGGKVTTAEIIDAVGLSAVAVHKQLNKLLDNNEIVRPAKGEWAIAS